MSRPHRNVAVGLLLSGLTCSAAADELSNPMFRIQYSGSGITSLERTGDAHDTNYVAPNGALGPLIVRYRTTANGDWRELRDVLITATANQSITFTLLTLLPSLAARSTGQAAVGAGGVRALNDGVVPIAAGAGRGGATTVTGRTDNDVPLFTWAGSRGAVQWVQYTFPAEEEVSMIKVFWTIPPDDWRLLYADGGEWKEVVPRGPYGRDAGMFTTVEFAPVKTLAMRIEVRMRAEATVALAEWRVGPEPELVPASDLHVEETFRFNGNALDWSIVLRNESSREVEIGDLAVPLNFAERAGARGDIYTHKLLRHALVAGHGSWVYWQRSNGEGPYLVMTPGGRTKLEYFDSSGGIYTPYIHGSAASAAARAMGGNWRLPVSSLRLTPKGTAGATVTYTFRFQWANDFAGVRDVLYAEGKFDTAIIPGMVVPVDLPAMISLRTKNTVTSLQAEHASSTKVERAASADGSSTYVVRFSRLGENMLTIRYGDRQWTTLEFFVTEPLETVIRKRAAFLVSHQQHTDPDKWYVGAYSDWDQKNEIRRSPEDRDSLSTWLTDANDDAGNARPAFVASKNVFFPDQHEIEGLELYISKYLWGGMQMTDREKYPYALYGIPNWKANRASPDPGRNGQAHVWRIYDYPHIVMLYYRMYQIAKFYPQKVKYLDASGYLERAYRTAAAYWTMPNEIEHWSADAVGTMNEAFIPELIDALDREGKHEWAESLRRFWEGKVDRFVNHTPNLYGSEFAFDSTGFESTGAFAHYAMEHTGASGDSSLLAATDFRRRVTREAAAKFMDFQLLLNMSDRGWLETTYYQLGSDYRGNLSYLLSYMSQMGGWSILDYGLHFAADPAEYLRLGYASSLSSWALVNSGDAKSGYGYWFPSRNNDGAAGGGFMPEPRGRAWIGKTMTRGAWYYSAEEDVGYCAALRTHATVVTRDPRFGEIAYGGLLTRAGARISVIPRDGLRVRFHLIRDKQRFHMELDHDGYAKEQPITVVDDLSRVEFTLENRTGGAHEAGLTLAGLPSGHYEVSVNGRTIGSLEGAPEITRVSLPLGAAPTEQVAIHRTRSR